MTASQHYDVIALGELVIDLVPDRSAAGVDCFVPKPGGAPGNVAVGVARLGGRAAMLSKVGDEAFGRLLVETLSGHGVVVEGVRTTRAARTSLAFVTVAADGDQDFLLYRNGCAESTFGPDEIDEQAIGRARILHLGSLFLGQAACAAAQRRAVEVARQAGALVSVDVNLRASLWPGPREMLVAAQEAAASADILKVSKQELAFLTGEADISQAIAKLWRPGLRLIAVTLGSAGAIVATARHQAHAPGFPVSVVDTVGCGDAFMASLLTDVARSQADLDSLAGLERLARRACGAGALAATAAGAMGAMPTSAQRDALLARVGSGRGEGVEPVP